VVRIYSTLWSNSPPAPHIAGNCRPTSNHEKNLDISAILSRFINKTTLRFCSEKYCFISGTLVAQGTADKADDAPGIGKRSKQR
jgi:hypothetical protein